MNAEYLTAFLIWFFHWVLYGFSTGSFYFNQIMRKVTWEDSEHRNLSVWNQGSWKKKTKSTVFYSNSWVSSQCTFQRLVTGTLFSTQSIQNPAADSVKKVQIFVGTLASIWLTRTNKNHRSRFFLEVDQH